MIFFLKATFLFLEMLCFFPPLERKAKKKLARGKIVYLLLISLFA